MQADYSTDRTEHISYEFKPGDLIVMCNTGIMESSVKYVDTTRWVKDYLKK